MSRNWTIDQKNVIDIRGKNLLVSAAAGAGKTAVLVERIFSLITDPEQPTDIDRLLVMTFSNAAAAEMRERVTARIEEAIAEDPENMHLQRQSVLVHNAKICTIHSFCTQLIKNYFPRIGLEPGFRIGDENELKLLRTDVVTQLLDDWYEAGEAGFLDFCDGFSGDKEDESLAELILRVYEASISEVEPIAWLHRAREQYTLTPEKLEEAGWIKELVEYAHKQIHSALQVIDRAIEVCQRSEAFEGYEGTLQCDRAAIAPLLQYSTYGELQKALGALQFIDIKRKNKKMNPDRAELVKKSRGEIKDVFGELKEEYYSQTPVEICDGLQKAGASAGVLLRLAEEFLQRYAAAKREKNLLDYSDLEHFALQILRDGDKPSAVALDYARFFREIMIDEYQDSNDVQECILTSVSKWYLPEGERADNVFCVGDVKQSIYGFRRARPELFNSKYKAYPTYDPSKEQGGSVKVELHANFRSLDTVLHDINCLCRPLIREDLGNITYDDQAALYPGGNFSALCGIEDNRTEILVSEKTPENEGRMILAKIRELMDPEKGMKILSQNDAGEIVKRPVEYSDIAILFRNYKEKAVAIVELLKDAGIPVEAQSGSGFYKTYEIRMMVALLQIIDNPLQDIPMAAVMKSPLFGFRTTDLAEVGIHGKGTKGSFYNKIQTYIEKTPEGTLTERLMDMMACIARYREQSRYLSISELLRYIYDDLAVEEVVLAMPSGEKRLANVQMLMEQAISYEKTSYKGLFQFVRYLSQIEKYDVDISEAATANEDAQAVRVLTMHKSKGLEFPIVFVSGISTQFSTADAKQKVAISSKHGIGLEVVDLSIRSRYPTLLRKAIILQGRLDSRGEEQRILYVAATRAKQKLIFTMQLRNPEADLQKMQNTICMMDIPYEPNSPGIDTGKELERFLPFAERVDASSMGQWVVKAYRAYDETYEPQIYMENDLLSNDAAASLAKAYRREELLEEASHISEAEQARVAEAFDFRYPYEAQLSIPTKVSVSDVKMDAIRELEEKERVEEPFVDLDAEVQEKEEVYVPTFAGGTASDGPNYGALRGTAVHRVMECLDFTREFSKECIHEQIETMVASGKLEEEQQVMVREDEIVKFGTSGLANRMAAAAKCGQLHKEQPFVMSLPAERVSKDYEGTTPILVQGIIDGFFEEEDGIVLMDYKTDKLGAQELVDHYRVQLELYAHALEQALDKPVKEIFLYSFRLAQEIPVTVQK